MFGFPKRQEENDSQEPVSLQDSGLPPGFRIIHFVSPDLQNTADPIIPSILDSARLADFFERAHEHVEALYEQAGLDQEDDDPLDEIKSALEEAGFEVVDDEDNETVNLDVVPDAIDLSHEAARIYTYLLDNGETFEVEVDNPVSLTIAADGSHEITCYDRTGYIIPPDWFFITVHPNYGKPVFPGHNPVNEIDTGEDAGC